LISNPFVHLKEFDHEHGLDQRMGKTRNINMYAVLENDAKEGLIAMCGVAAYAFSR
jgi:hypothetical protein